MRIIITGSSGFIGKNLYEQLGGAHDLFPIDIKKSLKGQEKIDVVKTNLEKAVPGEWDAILHHAAIVSVPESIRNPVETMETNVMGTLNVLELARKKDIGKVVLASSAAVYGDTQRLPLKESDCPKPLTPYGTSKLANELNALEYSRYHGIRTVVFRYFNVYGKYQNPNNPYSGVICKFLDNALEGRDIVIYGDGKQTRDFVHVDDIVQANMIALAKIKKSDIFNVCTGEEIRIIDLANSIKRLAKSKSNVAFKENVSGDIYRSVGDATKLREYGFSPKNLREGLEKTFKLR
jgi:UDP-glucose 4-epimerase